MDMGLRFGQSAYSIPLASDCIRNQLVTHISPARSSPGTSAVTIGRIETLSTGVAKGMSCHRESPLSKNLLENKANTKSTGIK